MPLDLKKRLDEIAALYNESPAVGTFNALVIGESGSGKTKLLETARKPVLIDSFDPGGTKTIDPKLINKSIFVRRYEDDRSTKPTEYARWEKQWESDCKDGTLDAIGTYCIDSFTTMGQAIAAAISKKKGREEGALAIQDYAVIGNTIRDIIKICSSKGCDFIMTGHLEMEKDEISGEVLSRLKTFKSMKVDIPLLFDEKWVAVTRKTSNGIEYKLLTRNNGRFVASTRLGRDSKFEMFEDPDIKKLLSKAGYPTQDKEIK